MANKLISNLTALGATPAATDMCEVETAGGLPRRVTYAELVPLEDVTDLTALTAPAAADLLVIRDVNDLTDGADGTDKKITATAAGLRLNKLDGTTAPTANEDAGDGYTVGSLWIDTTADLAYVCVDATTTAAVWNALGAVSLGNWKLLYSNGTGVNTALALGAAGTVLTGGGTAAAPTFVNNWRRVFATADETIQSDDTVNIDPALQFSAASGVTYLVRLTAYFKAASATSDLRYLTAFSGTTSGNISAWRGQTAADLSSFTTDMEEAFTPSTTMLAGTSGTGRVTLENIFTTTSTGTWSFQWAQNTSEATNTTRLLGSFLEYIIVA